MKKAIISSVIASFLALICSFGFASASEITNINDSSYSPSVHAINWTINDYETNAGVEINLLRKVSETQFDFVRVLSYKHDVTTGFIYIPTNSELQESDLYIEVTCNPDFDYSNGCKTLGAPLKVF